MSSTITQIADSLDWPGDASSLETLMIQCAGRGFVDYEATVLAEANGQFLEEDDDLDEDDTNGKHHKHGKDKKDSVPAINLFELSEEQLDKLNYYQVLGMPFKPNLTPEDVKKYYRKASLKYHPDKSGRGEEDAVFLKVKTAFETLSTQKQAYDSTELSFDNSLPDPDFVTDFFKEYGIAFDRNLFFDARLLNNGNNNNNNNKKNGKTSNRRKSKRDSQLGNNNMPPSLGDENTPIEEVHQFYDYWTHFTTWRDFSIQAAQELETQDHLENAESRYEKRWYQKEIDKKAKKLKQQEQARITTLVETAMANDPRLIQEQKRLIEEKRQRQAQREQEAADKKQLEVEAQQEEERKAAEEKERKNNDKLQREKEKKQHRKVKQAFKKHVHEALTRTNQREHAMEDTVDVICTELDREALLALNDLITQEASHPAKVLELIAQKAEELGNKSSAEAKAALEEAKRMAAASAAAAKEAKAAKKIPFSKEELSILAKGVKKYPAGGSNRWDQIAQYINNVCRPDIPRTKEECISTYNSGATASVAAAAKGGAVTSNGANSTVSNGSSLPAPVKTVEVAAAAPPVAPSPTPTVIVAPTMTTTSAPVPSLVSESCDDGTDVWNDEQDQQLQAGLVQFPATIDKNERWTNIAKGVTGKSKKQCVQRFKTIRDAIKNKK
jgi:DnaJ homolog subfamily C member 2